MKSRFKRKIAARQTFAEVIKDRFDWDVAELESYTDEQSADIYTDLIFGSTFKDRINVMEGVKGSEKIKLLADSGITLQSAAACGWTPDGNVIFTDVTITSSRIKMQAEFCNEDLNATWAQLENAAGASNQDEEPVFADVLIAYYLKLAKKKDQDLIFNGDTASLDPELVFFDGLVKRWDTPGAIEVYYSTETTITNSNAFAIAIGLHDAIPAVVFDNDLPVEILVGRETYRKIINNVYEDNNFHSTLEQEAGPEPSFILPTTNIRVRAYSQLNGTNKMYAVPYSYIFYATDLSNDMEFRLVYNDTDEMIRFSAKWRAGINYVFGQYFTRLRLTPVS